MKNEQAIETGQVMSFVCAGAVERLGSSLSALMFSEGRLAAESVIRRRICCSHASRSEPAISCMGSGPQGNPLNPSSLAAILVAGRAGPTSGRYVQALGREFASETASPRFRPSRPSFLLATRAEFRRRFRRICAINAASQLAGALSPSGDSTAAAPSPGRYPPGHARRPRSGSPYRGP